MSAIVQTAVSLRFELRRAFSQLILAQENIKVARTVKEIREKGAQMVKLRYDSGRESLGNMLRTNAEFLQAEASLAQAGRSLRTAQMTLSEQLGFDDFQEVTVIETLTNAAPPGSALDLTGFLSDRPDIAVKEAALEGAEAGLKKSKSVVWPTLSAGYSRSWQDRNEFPSSQPNWTLGATLSLPLFGGGPTAAYFSIASAKNNMSAAKESLRSLKRQALSEMESARAEFANTADQVRVQKAMLEASRQRNKEADVRYASGLLTFDNWEIIVTDRVNSEKQSIQAWFNADSAQAAWHKAIGKALGSAIK